MNDASVIKDNAITRVEPKLKDMLLIINDRSELSKGVS